MSLPLVSVVMPLYNAAAFLKEAIDSVLHQSFQDFELILINDGSTDTSENIIKGYSDKRIVYLYQQNAGVAATLNKGVEMATGKYIWRHDADDISLPVKLEEQVKFLQNYPEFELCGVQVAFLTERGKPAWDFRQPNNKYFGAAPFIEVKREHFNPYSPITHGTVLMSTRSIRELGAYRKEFITGEDIDLWLRFLQRYRAAVLNQCLSLHRLSSSSATKVHGWKNEFFRNLAFEYFDQREKEGMDDLQKGTYIPPKAPETATEDADLLAGAKKQRENALGFLYPLYLNAKDWPATLDVVKLSLADGWKRTEIWKLILFPLLGKKVVRMGVKLKRSLRKVNG